MTIRRRAAVIGAVAVGLATLAACDKPTPLAYITSGTDSVHAEAQCYDDGDQISLGRVRQCLNAKPKKTITVHLGERIRFGVDPTIAKEGWSLGIEGQQINDPTKDTYHSYPVDGFFQADQTTGQRAKSVNVSIIENSLKKKEYYGVWNYKVKLAD
ncbi:DUF2771 domain-containing protein [Wenjunlia tyrosinilytica]|uniref:Lipoprotein n=1 Tax=Wenjunlia tyrosinilytica TaxID=1544741 RepID=A0A918DXB3_9ACTN|nr:DUF2771 domain-containing protein [Wenjunlia tyrosinilytica]GGO86962.1 lipoprotein [Wenjunlia tyrosinilytica]